MRVRLGLSLVLATMGRRSIFVPSWFYAGKGFLPATANHEFPKNAPSVRGSIFNLKKCFVLTTIRAKAPGNDPRLTTGSKDPWLAAG
jgi:hypothetical protein